MVDRPASPIPAPRLDDASSPMPCSQEDALVAEHTLKVEHTHHRVQALHDQLTLERAQRQALEEIVLGLQADNAQLLRETGRASAATSRSGSRTGYEEAWPSLCDDLAEAQQHINILQQHRVAHAQLLERHQAALVVQREALLNLVDHTRQESMALIRSTLAQAARTLRARKTAHSASTPAPPTCVASTQTHLEAADIGAKTTSALCDLDEKQEPASDKARALHQAHDALQSTLRRCHEANQTLTGQQQGLLTRLSDLQARLRHAHTTARTLPSLPAPPCRVDAATSPPPSPLRTATSKCHPESHDHKRDCIQSSPDHLHRQATDELASSPKSKPAPDSASDMDYIPASSPDPDPAPEQNDCTDKDQTNGGAAITEQPTTDHGHDQPAALVTPRAGPGLASHRLTHEHPCPTDARTHLSTNVDAHAHAKLRLAWPDTKTNQPVANAISPQTAAATMTQIARLGLPAQPLPRPPRPPLARPALAPITSSSNDLHNRSSSSTGAISSASSPASSPRRQPGLRARPLPPPPPDGLSSSGTSVQTTPDRLTMSSPEVADTPGPAPPLLARDQHAPSVIPRHRVALCFSGFKPGLLDYDTATRDRLVEAARRAGFFVHESDQNLEHITHVVAPNGCRTVKGWPVDEASNGGCKLPESPFAGRRYRLSDDFAQDIRPAKLQHLRLILEQYGGGQLVQDGTPDVWIVNPRRPAAMGQCSQSWAEILGSIPTHAELLRTQLGRSSLPSNLLAELGGLASPRTLALEAQLRDRPGAEYAQRPVVRPFAGHSPSMLAPDGTAGRPLSKRTKRTKTRPLPRPLPFFTR
ncbi:uncharacterized protein MONBRDRAFT_38340 [Monosiga brevicollis MX1]|uniref:BRCT domain-containing protein n=1 Tax=Monosiga brevicollis TaxID=81824 RepID=A9V739_MONBE|nr:uncharacterized protein MONBRDRAFT_38340 [Monosiga brevicollis MX1]EDQ86652.1 predicted protein [Monosiga brevicollis MX1]|eukprot:XP_001748488.1 hypothetical protein [Monosiga brevicollis MX1]